MKKKTCFVVIGYGIKMDHASGRNLNLANSYSNLIEPVCEELGLYCFRASDRNYENSGFIDKDMFDYLLKSDLVLADVSTLNPNAIYELGIRHALRPYSTIIIAEEGTQIPFDFGRNVIEKYKHLGEDIGVTEANRFKGILKRKIESVMINSQIDSPVYTMIPNLKPPVFTEEEIKELIAEEKENKKKDLSLAQYIKDGEVAKNNGEYRIAKFLFEKAIKLAPSEVFLKQRLALVTYKAQEPNYKTALLSALKILEEIGNDESTDIETLGLSGAVYKRLYEIEHNPEFLNQSINFYKRGFCIGRDYYNGINLAFTLLVRAVRVQKDWNEVQTDYILAQRTRIEVKAICENLINMNEFSERPQDQRIWIYLTLAEVLTAANDIKESNRILDVLDNLSTEKFYLETYQEQSTKLKGLFSEYQIIKENNNPKNGFKAAAR